MRMAFGFARRWWVLTPAALVLVLVGLVAVAHTPPVRRAALARAIAILQDRLNIILKAKSLDYNLFTLRVTLSSVDLSAITTPDAPFVHADALTVDLPWSALYGPFALEQVVMENARVRIVRRADGTSNLPPSQASTGESAALPVGRITIPRLAVEVSDEPSDVTLSLPALAIDVGSRNGVLRQLAPGSVRRGSERTEITSLSGGVLFDGRAVRLESFALATTEGAMRVDGTLVVFANEPSLDLQLRGTTDVDRATRWTLTGPRPSGTLSFDGTAKGVMAAPTLALRLQSDALTWQGLTASNLRTAIDIDGQRLLVRALEAGVVDGRVTGDADVTFEQGNVALTASWANLDASALVRAFAPELAVRPAGRASGTVSMKGTGEDLAQWDIDVQNQMAPGRAAPNQLPVSGTARLRTIDGTWRLLATQRVADAPVRVDVNGRLNSRDLASSTLAGQLLVDETDVSRVLVALSTARVVNAPPKIAGSLHADVGLTGTLNAPRVQITTVAQDLSAGGVSGLTADLTATGTMQSLAIDARVRQNPGNVIFATGTVSPEASRLDVHVTGRLQDPARLADVPVVGVVDVDFEGAGPFDAIMGRGTVMVADLTYDTMRLGRLESTIELDPTSAHVNTSLNDFRATAEGRLALAAPHEATIDLRVTEADIERIVRDQNLPAPVSGLVSLTARATGALDEWRRGTASVDISRLEARAGDLPLRLLSPAQLNYREGIARVGSFEAAVGDTLVSIAGDLPILEEAARVSVTDALRATLTGDVAQVLSAVRATGLADLPPVMGRGPLALLARVTGSAQEPVLAADLELGPGSLAFADWPEATNLQVRAHLDEGILDVDEATAEWQGSRITADALVPIGMLEPYVPAALAERLPPARGAAALNVKAALTPRVLEPFLDAETVAQLEGATDATLHLEASSLTLDAVEGDLRLDRFDVRVANLQVTQREPTHIAVSRGVARVVAWDWAGEGTKLEVRGEVRLKDEEAAITANGPVDLRLITPFVRNAGLSTAGSLESRVSITGPLRDPQIGGEVELSGGEVRLASPRIVATDLNGRAVLSRTSGDLASLTGTVNGGALTGGGHFEYGPNPLSAELTTTIRNMAMDFPEGLRSELNTDLTLRLAEDQGTEVVSGTLSGTVTVLRGSYREPLAVATELMARLRTERVAAAATPQPESLAERLALNIRVLTEEDVSVDNNYGRLALGGDLRIIGTAVAPAISGRATLREGGQLFLGRNTYTLEEGTIDFTNPVTTEPNMNIVARTRAGGEEIELTIKGTPANLSVEPRAINDPQLGVADVWSLLLTGRRLDEISGDEKEIVGEQVLGYVSGDVLGVASRAVGLDTIRLGAIDESAMRRDPTMLATEVDPTARLTFGESIGDKVDVTFSQNLRDGDAQTWIVDYLPARQLVVRFVTDDADLRSYQFRHEILFGEGRPAKSTTRSADKGDLRVTAITINGNLVLPEERVRDVLRLTAGDRFDFVAWQRDRDRLEQLYRDEGYREVRLDARRAEDAQGITLSYDIEAGSRTTLAISGYQLPRRTIEAVEGAWNGSGFDGFLVDDTTSLVRQALSEDGYLRAEVRAAVVTNDGVKTLSIMIVPGERTTEYRVRIEGKDEDLTRDLEGWLRDQRLDRLAWRDRDALESALTNELRARGHLRAEVTLGLPLFEGPVATLPVTVEAGPVFTVSGVSLEGVRTLYDATLNALAIEPGAPYAPMAVDAARDRVVTVYRRAGFSQARVTVRPDVNAERRQVALVFQIEEGPRQVLEEVLVSGNRSIDEDVVTRALGVKIGDPLGLDTWLQARTRIFETGLFRRVDLTVEPLETAEANNATRPMRIQVTVQEWPQLRLRYGFTVEEQRPAEEVRGRDLVPGLSADITRRTLFGRAIAVGGALEYQRRRELGRGFLNAPTFLSLPIESSLTVQRSREDFADATLVADRSVISWEQRFRLARRLRLSYSYRFEKNHTFDTAPLDPDFPFDVTVNVAGLTGTAAYDARDNAVDASRGWLLSSSFDYAPTELGSQFPFVKYLGQAYHFRPWRGTVLASAARVGVATPLGGQELIPSERFFAGGARSVRGVEEDRLGPLDFFGDPVGGQGLLVFNQEVRFPLFRWFRGVGFVDAGNVFPKVSDLRLGGLTGAVGLGLRVATPFALLRVDYGRLWSPGPNEPSGVWTFGIGQAF